MTGGFLMNKIRIVLVLVALLSAQQIFADDAQDMSGDAAAGKPCAPIANACMTAGFGRMEAAGKRFWMDCMKPVIMGQSVSGVTVDPAMVKACRSYKIDEMKKELKELQKAMSMK